MRAQQQGKKYLIGFIAHEYETMYDAFFEGLRELGYIEGQNITIERRYAEGQPERFKAFAREMVELNADVIVTVTTPAVLAIKKRDHDDSNCHPERNRCSRSRFSRQLGPPRRERHGRHAPSGGTQR